jgi:hypothetical protein
VLALGWIKRCVPVSMVTPALGNGPKDFELRQKHQARLRDKATNQTNAALLLD